MPISMLIVRMIVRRIFRKIIGIFRWRLSVLFGCCWKRCLCWYFVCFLRGRLTGLPPHPKLREKAILLLMFSWHVCIFIFIFCGRRIVSFPVRRRDGCSWLAVI